MLEEKQIHDQIGATITTQYKKAKEKILVSKSLQFVDIFYLMKQGRPITNFYYHKTLFDLADVQHFPNSHSSDRNGWEMAKCLALVGKEDLVESVKKPRFISLSIEVTMVDITSLVCIHVYTFIEHVRQPHLLTIHRMKEACNSENLFNLVVNSLKEVANLDDMEIARKLICVGADGASVMQGNKNELCIRLQTSVAPYMILIHCMAHKLNLAYKIVITHTCVAKVEELINEVYAYFSKSSKRNVEFQ